VQKHLSICVQQDVHDKNTNEHTTTTRMRDRFRIKLSQITIFDTFLPDWRRSSKEASGFATR
jgi:hypothetical protein